MPLARAALYEKGVTLYVSPNTNDNPEWRSTVRHICHRGPVLLPQLRHADPPQQLSPGSPLLQEIARLPELACRGGSCIVDPRGHYVVEPVWDREAILTADLDMSLVPASRMEFDPCGHYARPDVLELTVHE